MIVIDVRAASDFKLGALPESVNVPYAGRAVAPSGNGDSESSDEDDFVRSVEEQLDKRGFRKCRKVICVAGNTHQTKVVVRCAELLVGRLAMPRVTALHNGIDVFKTIPGVLYVPNA